MQIPEKRYFIDIVKITTNIKYQIYINKQKNLLKSKLFHCQLIVLMIKGAGFFFGHLTLVFSNDHFQHKDAEHVLFLEIKKFACH